MIGQEKKYFIFHWSNQSYLFIRHRLKLDNKSNSLQYCSWSWPVFFLFSSRIESCSTPQVRQRFLKPISRHPSDKLQLQRSAISGTLCWSRGRMSSKGPIKNDVTQDLNSNQSDKEFDLSLDYVTSFIKKTYLLCSQGNIYARGRGWYRMSSRQPTTSLVVY